MQPDRRPRAPRRRVVGLWWYGLILACGHRITRVWPRGVYLVQRKRSRPTWAELRDFRIGKHTRRACLECAWWRDELEGRHAA